MVDSFQKRERQRRTAEKNRNKQDRRREKTLARRRASDRAGESDRPVPQTRDSALGSDVR